MLYLLNESISLKDVLLSSEKSMVVADIEGTGSDSTFSFAISHAVLGFQDQILENHVLLLSTAISKENKYQW